MECCAIGAGIVMAISWLFGNKKTMSADSEGQSNVMERDWSGKNFQPEPEKRPTCGTCLGTGLVRGASFGEAYDCIACRGTGKR